MTHRSLQLAEELSLGSLVLNIKLDKDKETQYFTKLNAHILSKCGAAEDFPAPLPLFLADAVGQAVIKVETPIVPVVQLVVVVDQFIKYIHPQGRHPL